MSMRQDQRVDFETKLSLDTSVSMLPESMVRCVQKNTFIHIEEASPVNRRPRSKSDVTTLSVGRSNSGHDTEEGIIDKESSTVDEESPRGRRSRLESLEEWPGQETPQFTAAVAFVAAPPMQLPEMAHSDVRGEEAGQADRPRKKKDTTRRADVTLMLRNIPNKYTQDVLLEELARYLPSIDFFYLPIDFRNQCNLGYAFLNFKDGAIANAFQSAYDGNRLARFPQSPKVLQVHMARVQGLQANVKRLRNSSVMGMLTEDCKPVLFEGGEMKPLGHREQTSRRGRRAR